MKAACVRSRPFKEHERRGRAGVGALRGWTVRSRFGRRPAVAATRAAPALGDMDILEKTTSLTAGLLSYAHDCVFGSKSLIVHVCNATATKLKLVQTSSATGDCVACFSILHPGEVGAARFSGTGGLSCVCARLGRLLSNVSVDQGFARGLSRVHRGRSIKKPESGRLVLGFGRCSAFQFWALGARGRPYVGPRTPKSAPAPREQAARISAATREVSSSVETRARTSDHRPNPHLERPCPGVVL